MRKSKVAAQIPIFITVRGYNNEIIKKHKEALKFSYLFIKEQGLFSQTYIISDNKEILNYAIDLGFTNAIHYPCGSKKDLKYLEYLATYRYAVEHDYHPDWIILLNINQLFNSRTLIADCIQNIDNKYDVVASYTEISNRSHFFVDEALSKNDKDVHLLSSEYDRVKMVDASIYAVKTDFAFSCMEYDDPSNHFWNGKIKYFKNSSVYTDIYDINDILKYYKITNTLIEAQNIK
jgi:hypothetical protein